MGRNFLWHICNQYVLLLINFSDIINECGIMTYGKTSIQTMISSSCKTALHHTAPKQLKIFFETTRPISLQKWTLRSPDLNPIDYSVWDILQRLVYEGRREPFANLRDLQNVFRDNGTISMTRESEKLYCSGKGV